MQCFVGDRLRYLLRMELVNPKAARIERMVSRKIDTALSRDLRRHIERDGRRWNDSKSPLTFVTRQCKGRLRTA